MTLYLFMILFYFLLTAVVIAMGRTGRMKPAMSKLLTHVFLLFAIVWFIAGLLAVMQPSINWSQFTIPASIVLILAMARKLNRNYEADQQQNP